MIARTMVLTVLVLAASHLVRGSDPAPVDLAAPLSALPLQINGWRGVEGAPIAPEVEAVLGADDYVNRVYARADASAVGLWVAFYSAQRQGDAIHSPLNCLPGTGWVPVAQSRPLLRLGDRDVRVNRYVVQKRGERQVVTYWFQGRGRIIASEYANKAYLLLDAVRLRRTDGAIVRLIAPVLDDEVGADRAVAAFAADLQPQLARWIP